MSVWQKCSDVAVVDSGDRVVVLDLSEVPGSVPRSLEGSGGEIWRLIDGVRTEEELIGALAGSFRVDAGSIAADVHAFLARLEREGLIAARSAVSGASR